MTSPLVQAASNLAQGDGAGQPVNLLEMGATPVTPAQALEAQAAQDAAAQPLSGETPAQYQQRMASGGAIPAGAVQVENPLVQAAANLAGGGGGTPTQPQQPQPMTDMGTPAPMVAPGQGGMTPPAPGMGGLPTQTGATEMSTAVQMGTPLDKKTQDEVDAYNARQQAENERARKAYGELEKLYNDPAFQKALDDHSKISAEVMKSTENYGEYLEELVKMKKDYQASLDKSMGRVDPNKFWNERSTGDKIMGGIAIFLGGLGAGPGGQNTALKIIDDAIARDINAQEVNIELARKEAAAKGEILKTEMDVREFIDRKKVERLAVADQVVLGMLRNIETRQMPIEARQRLEQMISEKEKAALDTKIALFQMGVNKVTQSFSARTENKPADMSKMQEIQTPWGFAYDRDAAKTVRTAANMYEATDDTLIELEKYLTEIGDSPMTREQKGRAEGLAERWIGLKIAALNSGTLGESEYGRYLQSSPVSPEWIRSLYTAEQGLAVLKEARKTNQSAAVNTAMSYMPQRYVQFPTRRRELQTLYNEKTGQGFVPTPTGGQ